MSSILLTVNGRGRWRNSTVPGAFASHHDTILRMLRCRCKEVLSVLTSNRKEVLSLLTSHCKEVLVPLYDPRASHCKKPQEVAGLQTQKGLILHTWCTRIADENESRACNANPYDKTQNRFKYRRKQSIGTSSTFARNKNVSFQTRCVSQDGGNLPLSGTVH